MFLSSLCRPWVSSLTNVSALGGSFEVSGLFILIAFSRSSIFIYRKNQTFRNTVCTVCNYSKYFRDISSCLTSETDGFLFLFSFSDGPLATVFSGARTVTSFVTVGVFTCKSKELQIIQLLHNECLQLYLSKNTCNYIQHEQYLAQIRFSTSLIVDLIQCISKYVFIHTHLCICKTMAMYFKLFAKNFE